MNFDTILIHLGEFGPWQRRNNLLLWLPLIGSGVNVMVAALAVMAPRHGYRCRNSCDVTGDFTWQVPGHAPGDIFPSLDVNSSFYSPDSPDYCQHYMAIPAGDGGDSCTFNRSHIIHCRAGDDFAYEHFEMERTVATDNNLVCGRYFWTIIVDELFMLGLFLGSSLFGVLSDRLGRRPALLSSVLTCALGNLAGCATTSAWSYGLTRLVSAGGSQGVCVVAMTMVMEYSGVRERVPLVPWVTWSTLLTSYSAIPFALGEAVPPLLATGLKDWRIFQAVISLLIAVTALVWPLLPESPRWLIAQGRLPEARQVIEAASESNQVRLTGEVWAGGRDTGGRPSSPQPVYGVRDLARTSQLPITLALFLCWPVITLLYYGLSLSADKIHMTDNVFLSFVLVALIEIPSNLIVPLVIDILGRRPIFALTQLVPGLCCIAAAFLQPGTAVFSVLTLGAKALVTAAFTICYLYTAQLFPTSVRATAVGACSTMARLGGAAAPFVGKYLTELTGSVSDILPLCVFGAVGVLGGLVAFILPDTVGFPLPDTFQDVEDIKDHQKPFWTCYGGPQSLRKGKDSEQSTSNFGTFSQAIHR